MGAITAVHEVVRVANARMQAEGLPGLSFEQARVLAEVIDRWYGVPTSMPGDDTIAAWKVGR
jgi:hypothetical protein